MWHALKNYRISSCLAPFSQLYLFWVFSDFLRGNPWYKAYGAFQLCLGYFSEGHWSYSCSLTAISCSYRDNFFWVTGISLTIKAFLTTWSRRITKKLRKNYGYDGQTIKASTSLSHITKSAFIGVMFSSLIRVRYYIKAQLLEKWDKINQRFRNRLVKVKKALQP